MWLIYRKIFLFGSVPKKVRYFLLSVGSVVYTEYREKTRYNSMNGTSNISHTVFHINIYDFILLDFTIKSLQKKYHELFLVVPFLTKKASNP